MSLQNKIIQSLYMKCDDCGSESNNFTDKKSTEIIKILKDEGWTNISFYKKTLSVEHWSCPSCSKKKVEEAASTKEIVEEVKEIVEETAAKPAEEKPTD